MYACYAYIIMRVTSTSMVSTSWLAPPRRRFRTRFSNHTQRVRARVRVCVCVHIRTLTTHAQPTHNQHHPPRIRRSSEAPRAIHANTHTNVPWNLVIRRACQCCWCCAAAVRCVASGSRGIVLGVHNAMHSRAARGHGHIIKKDNVVGRRSTVDSQRARERQAPRIILHLRACPIRIQTQHTLVWWEPGFVCDWWRTTQIGPRGWKLLLLERTICLPLYIEKGFFVKI